MVGKENAEITLDFAVAKLGRQFLNVLSWFISRLDSLIFSSDSNLAGLGLPSYVIFLLPALSIIIGELSLSLLTGRGIVLPTPIGSELFQFSARVIAGIDVGNNE